MPQKIIVDVDTGIDDAKALMLALTFSEKVEIVAITCVQGNTDLHHVCRNTVRLLTLCNRRDIPVYRGCCKSLTGNVVTAKHYHGEDGLGDVPNQEEVDESIIQKEHASAAIVRLLNENPGEISLVLLAPLTNIAVALRLDPDLGQKVKDVMIMGGNIEGKGNVTPATEFNFHCDPEAAYILLNEMQCSITITPYETCTKNGPDWEWVQNWLSGGTDKARFFNNICKNIITRQRDVNKQNFYRSCDLLTVAMVIDPTIITVMKEIYAEVEISGKWTSGQLICDWKKVMGKSPNVKVIEGFDNAKAMKLYEKMFL